MDVRVSREPISVALVDDHRLFLDGVSECLRTRADEIEIVAEATDVTAAWDAIARSRPRVAIVDLFLRHMTATELIKRLREQFPEIRILVLTGHARFVSEALSAGADGYALKAQSADEIIAAICAVAEGERYIAPTLAVDDPDKPVIGVSILSPREREIFDLIVEGFSNIRIALRLQISAKTVETHRAHINAKLDVHSTAELIRYAVDHGLLTAAIE